MRRGLAITTVIILATVLAGLILVGFLAFSFNSSDNVGDVKNPIEQGNQEQVPGNPTSGEPIQPTVPSNLNPSNTGGGGGGGGGGSGSGNTGGTSTTTANTTQNHAPFASDQFGSLNKNTTFLLTLYGTDIDNDDLTFSVTSAPIHGTLGVIDNTALSYARVSYTPTIGYVGFDSFSFRASDGNLSSAQATFTLNIEDSCTSNTEVNVSTQGELLNALTNAAGCEIILLANGNYGDVSISGYPDRVHMNYPQYVTIKSTNSYGAIFEKLDIAYASHIRFDNIIVHHPMRIGEADWSRAVDISYSDHLEFLNSEFYGSEDGDYENDIYGFLASDVNNLRLENNEFHDWTRGSVIGGSDNVVVRNNYYHGLRSDGADFGGDVNVLVEGNRFTNFYPCCGDHPDAIQFWNDNGVRTMRDVTIRNNIILRGFGDVTQSIFIQSNTPQFRNLNFTIEGNVIYQSHIHGITISDTDDVVIKHNTVLMYRVNVSDLVTGINTINMVDALVQDNIASLYGLDNHTTNQNNVLAQNGVTAQERALATHYDNLFLNANAGSSAEVDDFRPKPGSILIVNPGLDIGALEYNPNPSQLMAVILSNVSSGPVPLTVRFDGSLSGGPSPIIHYDWDFDDGTSGTGAIIEHTFQSPNTYDVTLMVSDSGSSTDIAHKSIAANPPPVVGLIFGLSLDGHLVDSSANHLSSEWTNLANYGEGILNQGAYFDGTSNGSYIHVPYDLVLDGMNELTFAFWAKKTTPLIGGNALLKHITYWAYVDDSHFAGYLFNEAGGRFDFSAPSSGILDTNWHHYALTYDGALVRTYIDGQFVNSIPMTGALVIHQDRDLDIGKDPWGVSFNGVLDEFKIYNIALGASEVSDLYNEGSTCLPLGCSPISQQHTEEENLFGKLINKIQSLFTGRVTSSLEQVSGNATSVEELPNNKMIGLALILAGALTLFLLLRGKRVTA